MGVCQRGDVATTIRPAALTWTTVAPVAALVVLASTWGGDPGAVVVVVVGAALVGAVLAAVHHAEVVAHRVGEPYGPLVLGLGPTQLVLLAVTVVVAVLTVVPGRATRPGHPAAGVVHLLLLAGFLFLAVAP